MINSSLIHIYDTTTNYVPEEFFNIKRVKTALADEVPFEMLGRDYLFKITMPVYDEENCTRKVESFYLQHVDAETLLSLAETALIMGAEWPKHNSRFLPNFLEMDYPRERKWNPDCPAFLIPHWNILTEEMGDDFAGDPDDGWEVMTEYLEWVESKNRIRIVGDDAPF